MSVLGLGSTAGAAGTAGAGAGAAGAGSALGGLLGGTTALQGPLTASQAAAGATGLGSVGTGLTGFAQGALNGLLTGSPGLYGMSPQLGAALSQFLASRLGGSEAGSMLLNGAQAVIPHPATRMIGRAPAPWEGGQRSVIGGIISGILGQ